MTYPLDRLATAMGMSENAALQRLGVSGTTAQAYRRDGVTWRVADRLAVKAGFHPGQVWPEWIDDAIADAHVQCAASDCDTAFIPGDPRQMYCHQRCRARAHAQKVRRSPEGRQRENERRRRYYAENSDYERARENRRYWSDPERWRAARRDRYHEKKGAA